MTIMSQILTLLITLHVHWSSIGLLLEQSTVYTQTLQGTVPCISWYAPCELGFEGFVVMWRVMHGTLGWACCCLMPDTCC